MLVIYGVILEVIAELRPAIEAVARCDGDLARQMRRAASSVALNTAEGMYSQGKNRGARYYNAVCVGPGLMHETLACLEVRVALGYLPRVDDGARRGSDPQDHRHPSQARRQIDEASRGRARCSASPDITSRR